MDEATKDLLGRVGDYLADKLNADFRSGKAGEGADWRACDLLNEINAKFILEISNELRELQAKMN